jgi:hypothetical protein
LGFLNSDPMTTSWGKKRAVDGPKLSELSQDLNYWGATVIICILYSFFILCINFHVAACRPNFVKVAHTI